MCNATAVKPVRFDPRLCPLLCGLPPEEQEERMREDPRIRACIEALEGKAAPTPSVSKLIHAYEHCASEACAAARSEDDPASLADAG